MNETHLDIFSGLGGFAIAAREAGFRTVAFCESDSRCREFLQKTWGLPVEPDIRKLDGRKYAGVSLLTGGPPCQPASRAGKQGGAGDDRWLWDEALRVLEEAVPSAVVFENPPGILDVGIDGILSEMGRFGYETQCFDIPACAVDSPQLRHRIWIVGFLENSLRKQIERNEQRELVGTIGRTSSEHLADAPEPGHQGSISEPGRQRVPTEYGLSEQSLVADTECERRKRRSAESREAEGRQSLSPVTGLHWQNSIWVPCADGKLRRAPDDSFMLVDGLHRSILGALGNSIVPQVAVEILCGIKTVLDNGIQSATHR